MEEEIEKLIKCAELLVEQANKIKGMQNGMIYTNICKNCGKEIKVARKNHYFCDSECKKEFTVRKNKEYYKKRKESLTEEEIKKENEMAVKRMRELRTKRKESVVE